MEVIAVMICIPAIWLNSYIKNNSNIIRPYSNATYVRGNCILISGIMKFIPVNRDHLGD